MEPYTPTRITLTQATGFTTEVASKLREVAEKENRDPREVATELLRQRLDEVLREGNDAND